MSPQLCLSLWMIDYVWAAVQQLADATEQHCGSTVAILVHCMPTPNLTLERSDILGKID